MTRKVIVKSNIKPENYKPGDKFSSQFHVVDVKRDYLVVARLFKNGHPKKMSKRFVFTHK